MWSLFKRPKREIKNISEEMLNNKIDELNVKLKRQVKTSIVASETILEDKINKKLDIITEVVESIKADAINFSAIKEWQKKSHNNNIAVVDLMKSLTNRLNEAEKKFKDSLSEHTQNIDEQIENTDARLDSFIDVMSEKIVELGKKKSELEKSSKFTAKIFSNNKCPFDLRIGKCEVWASRPNKNDAPNACAACRSAVLLQERGITNVSIQQIAASHT